jgi:pimeloyl-ACP methyl ester carboxylesterase
VRTAAVLLVAGAIGAASCAATDRGAAAPALTRESCTGVRAPGAVCYSLTVPENRASPSRTIALRIVVLPATGTPRAPDPVFYLAGGPGQAASSMAGDPSPAPNVLRVHRDLVYADQRGTGASNGLDCPFYGPPDTPQSYFTEFLPLNKVRDCRDRMARRADLTQYTTAASVDDLDAIRAAMNYAHINLVGGSYGTRLAMEYVRRYEEHVRSVVLESPVTPATHAPEAFGRFAASALDGLVRECAEAPECARAFPKLRIEVDEVFARLRERPAVATVAHPAGGRPGAITLTRNHVAEVIRYMMYSSRGASSVPWAIHRAFEGDFTPIAEFLIRWRANGSFDGLYLSITCAEDVPFMAADAAERDESTYLGSYRVREQRAACVEWPHGSPSPSQFEPVSSTVPVLMFSGTLDPVTPPSNADTVAKTLPNSLHVRIPSGGHSPVGLTGLDCIGGLQRGFIEQGSVAALDAKCVRDIRRLGFRVQ